MRRINVANYDITVSRADLSEHTTPYEVRKSLIGLLFADQAIDALELLARDDLARKIRDWADDDLLLEDAEYKKLESALTGFKQYRQHDAELVRRVLNAPEAEIGPKKSKK